MISLFKRIKWWINTDRIGPDIPVNHWKLFFKKTGLKLCKKKFAKFADDAEFRPHSYAVCCSKIELGKGVVIRPHSMLFASTAKIVIEDYVLLGSGIQIYTNNHKFSDPTIPIYFQDHDEDQEVIIKEGSWIGANAIILPGVTIGKNSVVGAGSIVTKDIPDFTVAVGNPARVVKKLKDSNKK